MNVIIIGGGIGGLALAQGLRRAGVPVAGVRAGHRSRPALGRLPDPHQPGRRPGAARLPARAGLAASSWPPPGRAATSVSSPRGSTSWSSSRSRSCTRAVPAPRDGHYAADRTTLRRILTTGLDDALHHGAEYVEHRRLPDGRVRARFADGRTAEGDVLVGADGAGSRLRRQYLPDVRVEDLGVVSVGHKVWLTEQTRAALPARLTTGMNVINAGAPVSMFTAVFEPPRGRLPAVPAVRAHRPRRSAAAGPADPRRRRPAGRGGRAASRAGTRRCARALAEAEPQTRNAIAFRATAPLPAWSPSPVTVLGDAIHLMPPVGGLGGNTALRDAHLLTRQLTAAHRGRAGPRSPRSRPTRRTCASTGRRRSAGRWPMPGRRRPVGPSRRWACGPGSGSARRSRRCAGAPSPASGPRPAAPRDWELTAA